MDDKLKDMNLDDLDDAMDDTQKEAQSKARKNLEPQSKGVGNQAKDDVSENPALQDERTADSVDKTTSTGSKAASPESKAASPESKAASPDSQAASPESNAASPESKAASPEDKEKASNESTASNANSSSERLSIEYGRTTKLSDMVPKVSEKPRHQIRTMQDREISMILKTQGRALSQALMSIAGTRQRSGRLWMTAGAMFLIIALLIIQVYYRHREVNLGYELSAAISQREALLEENRKLRIELRVLSRRDNLEAVAGKQLGMVTIRPEQVLIYDLKKTSPSDPSSSKKRIDGLDNVRRIGEE